MSFIKGYDPHTLREVIDPAQCAARLEEIQEQRSLPALLERVWLLKVLGRLDEALELSDESVRVARMAGTRKDLLRSRVLHATVQQAREAYEAADFELTRCAEEAEAQGWASIGAFALQHRGKVRFDAGDLEGAREDFKRVLFLRSEAGTPQERLEPTLMAIDATERRQAESFMAGADALS